MQKIESNMRKYQELAQTKMNRSAQQFKDARVVSCSQVLLRNGRAVCVAFPSNPKPANIAANKSSETTSFSS
jgi:predicted house-cleaning NTP pyrophosphatase (Maf/HAM1 superfamily)